MVAFIKTFSNLYNIIIMSRVRHCSFQIDHLNIFTVIWYQLTCYADQCLSPTNTNNIIILNFFIKVTSRGLT